MTSKEKARELFNKYLKYIPEFDYIEGECFRNNERNEETKELVLLILNEILDAVTIIADKKYDYFQEVKQEIKNLTL